MKAAHATGPLTDYGDDYVGIPDPSKPGHGFGGLNPVTPPSRGEGVLALGRTDDAEAVLASVPDAGGRVVVELHEHRADGGSPSPIPGAMSSGSTSQPSRCIRRARRSGSEHQERRQDG